MRFKQNLCYQPYFFQTNMEQTKFIVANDHDAIYVNLNTRNLTDLDCAFDIKQIQSIIYDVEEEEFYFLCNMKSGVTGFYLLKFPQDDPT